jgi:Zn-finger nucleic acid-binding protein
MVRIDKCPHCRLVVAVFGSAGVCVAEACRRAESEAYGREARWSPPHREAQREVAARIPRNNGRFVLDRGEVAA